MSESVVGERSEELELSSSWVGFKPVEELSSCESGVGTSSSSECWSLSTEDCELAELASSNMRLVFDL